MKYHCVKSLQIPSFFCPYFPVFLVILLQIIMFMAWNWSKFEETENNVDEGENDEVGYY